MDALMGLFDSDFYIDFDSERFYNNLLKLARYADKEDKSFLDFCSKIFEQLNSMFKTQVNCYLDDFWDDIYEDDFDDSEETITETIQKYTEEYRDFFRRIESILTSERVKEDASLLQLIEKSREKFQKLTKDAMGEKLERVLAKNYWRNLSDKDQIKFYRYMKSVNSKENS